MKPEVVVVGKNDFRMLDVLHLVRDTEKGISIIRNVPIVKGNFLNGVKFLGKQDIKESPFEQEEDYLTEERNFFEKFVNMDVSKWVEKKQSLDYLEWAAAVTLLKNEYPLSTFEVHKTESGRPWFTDVESNSGWVTVTLKIPELEFEQTDTLAIMDLRNQPVTADKCNSVTANKSIRRCLTKVIAEATGIGLTLYGKSEGTSDEKEVELSREKLSEIYKKKIKLGDDAKKSADAIVAETNEAITSAADDAEKLNIYAEARKKMLTIRK